MVLFNIQNDPIGALSQGLGSDRVETLILGGLTYTAGVFFYAWDRLPYNHMVWHGFVLGGSAIHFSAVMSLVGG